MRASGFFLLSLAGVFLTTVAAKAATCDGLFAMQTSTVDYYNSHAEDYNRTRSHFSSGLRHQLETFKLLLPRGARILEIGAGHGRDALHFISEGYDVVATEPSIELANIAAERIKRPVLVLRAQDINFDGEFDAIWANASLIHVPPEEMVAVLRKLKQAVKPGGLIHASFLEGVGEPGKPETIPDGRYFNRITENMIRNILIFVPGLRVDNLLTSHQRDDYFKSNAPTSTFGFFNLYMWREK